MFTLVRCHCCGEWQLVYNWNNQNPVYCEGCGLDRTGTGRGKSRILQALPSELATLERPETTNASITHLHTLAND
ncbi:MAG TPA: hypothetical protein VEL31_19510 [Ktedonobacteraceae bacterium]|nr:hypothetical protein [Ktedonobacteraceae bacterium]